MQRRRSPLSSFVGHGTAPLEPGPEGPGRGKRKLLIEIVAMWRTSSQSCTQPQPTLNDGLRMSTNVAAGCSCLLAWSPSSSPTVVPSVVVRVIPGRQLHGTDVY